MTNLAQVQYREGAYFPLPEGLDWQRIAASRARWGIDGLHAPLATGPGCIAWGRPLAGDYRVFFDGFGEGAAP